MSKMKTGVSLIGCMLILQCAATAAITPMDSADFPFKYEGGPTLPETALIASGATLSSDGNILSYSLPDGAAGAGTYVEPVEWSATVTHAYTVEASVKINSTSSSFGPFNFYTNGAGDNEGSYVFVGSSHITYFDNGAWTTRATADNTDALHAFRLAYDENTAALSIWRDGEWIADVAGAFGAGSGMYWLGGSSVTTGSADVDYVRWTAGAYSPVPEPMTVALLSLGGLFLRNRR